MLHRLVVALLVMVAVAAHAAPVQVAGFDARGQTFRLSDLRGQVIAVTLVSRWTRKELEKVNARLITRIAPARMAVVTVVDFIGIPKGFHAYARKQIIAGGKKSPVRFVADDLGIWRSYFDARPAKRVDIIVVDQHGEIRGHFVGAAQTQAALQLIDRLTGAGDPLAATVPARGK